MCVLGGGRGGRGGAGVGGMMCVYARVRARLGKSSLWLAVYLFTLSKNTTTKTEPRKRKKEDCNYAVDSS